MGGQSVNQFPGIGIPKTHSIICTGAGQTTRVGAEAHTRNGVAGFGQNVQQFAGDRIPQANLIIASAGQTAESG
jgi:hypothetical protein